MLDICLVSTHFAPETTGNAPYVAALAEGLAVRGHRVRVVAGAPHYPAWRVYPSEEWAERESTASGVDVRRLRGYVPSQPNFANRIIYELSHGMRFASAVPAEADAIVLTSPSLFASVVVRLRFLGRPKRPRIIVWVQDLYSAGVSETPTGLGRALGGIVGVIERALLKSCDQVVVIHRRFLEYLNQEFRLPVAKISVVRNWCHVHQNPRPQTEKVRSGLGWKDPSVEPVVLHAGNMGAKQGLEHVIEAARSAESRRLPLQFVLMGDGNQKARLMELGEGCPNLQFLDPVPDEQFMDVLASADILLVNERPSSSVAAVPSKLTSYFSAGRPVVAATDAGSVTSFEVELSGAGIVVPADDPANLVDASMRLLQDRITYQALSEAGQAFVESTLSSNVSLDQFSALLIDVVASARDSTREQHRKRVSPATRFRSSAARSK